MKGKRAIKKTKPRKSSGKKKQKIFKATKKSAKPRSKRSLGKKALVSRISGRKAVRSASRVKRKTATTKREAGARIVRLMGRGQFTVDQNTLMKLNGIDNSIVELINTDMVDEADFRKRLVELTDVVLKLGKPLDPKEIVPSDIMLPSSELSVDEARRIFKGEGTIPETFA